MLLFCYFFFNDTATTEIYTLSLHDALPIYFFARDGRLLSALRLPARLAARVGGHRHHRSARRRAHRGRGAERDGRRVRLDRKSTRLNSSHANISYAVFCLKKK